MSTELATTTRQITVGDRGLVVSTFEDLWRMAGVVVRGGLAPRGLETHEKVFAAMALGMELGIPPMASLRGVAVINGRPGIYGDVAMALVHKSGLMEYAKERIDGDGQNMVAYCEVKRAGRPEPVKRSFSVADAQKAQLWGKQGPWSQYPKRMLQMRARSFALRDEFSDVLQGMTLAEEIQDIPEEITVSEVKPKSQQIMDKINQALPAPETEPTDHVTAALDNPPNETTEPPAIIEAAGQDETAAPDEMTEWEKLLAGLDELADARGANGDAVKKAAVKCLPPKLTRTPDKASKDECDKIMATATKGVGFFAMLATKDGE